MIIYLQKIPTNNERSKMNLTLGERYVILGVLPTQSDFLTMKKVRELLDKLTPTDEERKKFDIKIVPSPQGNQIRWNDKGNTEKVDISIGEICEKEIVSKLKQLNEKKELTGEQVSVYEKFIEKDFGKDGRKK